jgi:UDP-N-acetylenolpyruvoylglucosamine reductase
MEFNYRTSIIKNKEKFFIISVKFDLNYLKEKYSSNEDNIYFRENRQPKGNTC